MAETQRRAAKGPGVAGAAVIAMTAAILMTWPLARGAGDHILAAIYGWDAYTNAMIMGGHVDAVLGRGPLSLYDDYFFAPLPRSIVFNENLFGLSFVFAPFYLVSGNPLLAYNLTLISSLALSTFFTYLLVRHLTGDGYAGALAGVAFAFCPYVFFEVGRIQLVATQWIPACFLCLHRAVERGRWRDAAAFWLSYLLQIGTCLYYAMFLVPLLALVAAVSFARLRPAPGLYARLAATGLLAGGVALAMVYPYFAAREAFALERSLSFASSYDGKLDFFRYVHDSNLTLTAMHHRGEMRGAHEEVAFPGFTVLGLLGLSLGVPLAQAVRRAPLRALGAVLASWVGILALGAAATLLTRSMLAGAFVLGAGLWLEARAGAPLPFSGRRGLYVAVLVLAVAMFLGLSPVRWGGAPVRGIYYYFHTYFPGFNGIRKVSRQAVMTTFGLVVLSSFGSSWVFAKLPWRWLRGVVFVGLLGASCYELRCFPHPLEDVWAGAGVPEAYRFLSSLPRRELVVALPEDTGSRRFRGDAGLALHNYLMLYHKHRSLNGQSSWLPPVTDLVHGALRRLPDEGARRILQAVGARYLLVHGEELERPRRDLVQQLAARPEHYRLLYQQDSQAVFAFSEVEDPSLALLETPPLPDRARLIAPGELRAWASVAPERAASGVDGDPRTAWATGRAQERGQSFEVALKRPRAFVAWEIDNPDHLAELPLSFQLSVQRGASDWETVVERPRLQVYREHVYSPKTFVFRVVLPRPVEADRVRLTVEQPVPGRELVIQEARLYAADP